MYARNFNFHSVFQNAGHIKKIVTTGKEISIRSCYELKNVIDISLLHLRRYSILSSYRLSSAMFPYGEERSLLQRSYLPLDEKTETRLQLLKHNLTTLNKSITGPDLPEPYTALNNLGVYMHNQNLGGGPVRVTCGELRERHAGRAVELVGRVQQQRKGKFVLLRDGHGSTQLMIPDNRADLSKRLSNLPLQSYVSIVGSVCRRPRGAINELMETGAVEVIIEEFLLVKVHREGQRLPPFLNIPGGPATMQVRGMASAAPASTLTALTSEEYRKCGGSKALEQRMKERSITCGQLGGVWPDTEVSVVGWLHSLTLPRFLHLRDGYGTVQCLFLPNKPELQAVASTIGASSIIEVRGKVSRRPDNCVNLNNKTGGIEIIIDSLAILDPDASPPSPPPEKITIDKVEEKGVNSHTWRSHTCGELRPEHAGQKVRLCGWLQFRRMGRFLTLRDGYGITQCLIPDDLTESLPKLDDIPLESVVEVLGEVMMRPEGAMNPEQITGEVEVMVSHLKLLNSASFHPFAIRHFQKAKEQLRLQYRYVDLRFPDMQYNLRTRSDMLMKMRKYLCDDHCFVEVETPTLFCRTPGGAQEFVVPTRHKGEFYSLVQSPQQFKQMLMAGSIDRYFQVARCYRDETIRGDRQPEFTQLDIEMSFAGREEILTLIEGLLRACWPRPLPDPIPRITYEEALTTYGSDKPDISYDLKFEDVTNAMKSNPSLAAEAQGDFGAFAIVCKGPMSNISSEFRKLLQAQGDDKYAKVKRYSLKLPGSLEHWYSSKLNTVLGEDTMRKMVEELHLEKNDFVLLAFGPKEDTCLCLGELRIRLGEELEGRKLLERRGGEHPLWVVDFPLFLRGALGLPETCHHPFTAPHPDDLHLLDTDIFKVRSLAYDLVMSGSEVGGGSVRAHDPVLQRRLLALLGLPDAPLDHFLQALSSGCPPHAGIALGLDRFVALACGAKSIRDVIAFPKSLEGRDPLSGAPAALTPFERTLYHLPEPAQ